MPIPTAPENQNLPQGPNFLGIVIGFGIAILIILLGTWLLLGHRRSILPVKTSTPSQTSLRFESPFVPAQAPPTLT